MRHTSRIFVVLLLAVAPGPPLSSSRQEPPTAIVTGTVAISRPPGVGGDHADVAVWLSAVNGSDAGPRAATTASRKKILQRNKQFEPRMLVVSTGSVVDFPNMDPYFHNVFSLFDGKRFDLGLYEAGSSRSVTFSRAGVCYVFCNIHPGMSAIVVAVDTPYYAVSSRAGTFTIPGVPTGRYLLSVWHDRYTPDTAGAFPREVDIGPASSTLGAIRLLDSGQGSAPHKNKYGRDYVAPPPSSPIYK